MQIVKKKLQIILDTNIPTAYISYSMEQIVEDTKPVMTRFTVPEFQKLKAVAEAERRSLGNMVRVLCDEAIAAREQQQAVVSETQTSA
jgi:hypothetical protein